jgi:hypothetical protein
MGLDHRRFLTARQISRLFYRTDAEAIPDEAERARALAAADRQVNRRTLRPLKDDGLVTVLRPFLLGQTTQLAQKEVNVLTPQGAEIVRRAYADAEQGQVLRWSRSWLEINGTNQAHASLLSDWYILARRAMRDGWRLQGFRDDRDLAQLTAQGMTRFQGNVPDGVFVLSLRSDGAQDRHVPFLLELDLGTETIWSVRRPMRDWTAKIERYLTYFAGPIRDDPLWTGIAESPHVLTLTTSRTRAENLLAATEAAGGDHRFLFATIDRLRGDLDPFGAFWQAPWLGARQTAAISLAELVGHR